MYYARTMERFWLEASEQFPVLLLTGPRQVGKTTLLRHLAGEKRRYVTLDDPLLRALANDDPALFLQRYRPPVLIDEIQYATGLLPRIKMMVDEGRKPGQFWLTGSQQFHLMEGVTESLAGRVALLNLLGLSQRERLQGRLDLPPFLPSATERMKESAHADLAQVYRRIWLGGFPGLIAGTISDRDLFYSSYLQTYLQRDVRDLAQVGNEASFLRFLKAAAARTGQILNLSDLAREADIKPNTAKNWLSILRTSFQVELLQPYHSNLTKRLVKSPKMYFLDTGLCAYLTEWSSPQTLEAGAMSGAIFETYVLSEILKGWWHCGKKPQLFYYRDKDQNEVDLLFVQDQKLHPVEIKKAASPKPEWLKPFQALKRLKMPARSGAVICLCPEQVPLSRSIQAVPVGSI